MGRQLSASRLSRRTMLGATAALAAGPALAEECRLGPAPHEKGARVFMDMDQQELDASYDQLAYEPLLPQVSKRLASNSEAMRLRIGTPQRESYGPSAAEGLDIYRTKQKNAPIFFFIHGGAWLRGTAAEYGYPAEMFVNAGAHYIAVDFVAIKEAGGDLGVMAKQVRSAVAWVHTNATTFGGDPARLYVGGHSSGGHLCGVVLVTDWQKEFGLPPDIIKGGLCMSGMYEMKPVALSVRSNYVKFTDAMQDSMSAMRHIDQLRAPITVTYGTFETPDFQRQSRDFAAAV
jgi:arylformamidase